MIDHRKLFKTEAGEYINEVIKPSKKKYLLDHGFYYWIWMILFGIAASLWTLGSYLDSEVDFTIIPLYVAAGTWALVIIIVCLLSKAHKNRYYALTDRRFIVRRGLFKVKQEYLWYKDFSGASVRIGNIDKLVKNTGSIIFGNYKESVIRMDNLLPMEAIIGFAFIDVFNPNKVLEKVHSSVEEYKNNISQGGWNNTNENWQ